MTKNDLWSFMTHPKPAVICTRGMNDTDHSIRVMACLTKCNWSKRMRHLIMKCKRALISDGGITRPTLTLAPMGMVAPWRCQELQISVRARQCLHLLGDGVIIWTDDTKPLTHLLNENLTENWLKLNWNSTQTDSMTNWNDGKNLTLTN